MVMPNAEAPARLVTITDLVRKKRQVDRNTKPTYRDPVPAPLTPVQPALNSSQEIEAWLAKNINKMDAPFAYLGDEPNTWIKKWADHDFRCCIIGGMSYISSEGNLAVPLIYSQLNHNRPQYITERSYFPNTRNELKMFWDEKVPFFSLENKHPLRDFDVLGFSVSYIMPFQHIGPMLHYSGINYYSLDRKQEDPIVIVGGCMSFVAEVICGGRGGIPDIVFIGESEDGLELLLDDIRDQRKRGVPRRDMLLDLQRRYGDRGVYVPQFYETEYYEDSKEIARRVKLEEGIPDRIRKAYLRDLNSGFILKDPFLSYAGGMAMGHLEIARGCSSACNFCQEGFNYRPYRERDISVAVPAMKELMENVGSTDVVPASFTSSDHHQINQIMKQLLETVTDEVQIISQRADAFGLDPTFAHLTGLGGSKTVSVGMEGISQRMRDIMTKAISEDNLLRTVEFALRSGYQSIKFFMITNVPGTTDADYEELLLFLDKCQILREKYNPKCEIKLSFTPLFISGLTPFQWHQATIEERTLTPWIPKIKGKGFGFRLGSGARHDEAYLSQVFHLGDRRLTTLMQESALEDNFYHFGTTPKGTADRWEERFKKKGVSFDFYFQEKHPDWNFSWDHVDNLTEKEALFSEYQRSRQAMGHLEPCINECYQCGACDADIWKQRKGWAKAKHADSQSVDLDKLQLIRQKGMVQRARLRVQVNDKHRFVSKDHWRLQFRRASYKNKVPLDKKTISMASDTIKMMNWISGVDYVDLKLTEHVFDHSLFTDEAFNKWFTGVKITNAVIYNDMKGINTIRDTCLYEIWTEVPRTQIESRIKWFLDQPLVTDEIPNDKPGRDGKVPREVKREFIKSHPTVARIKRMGFKGVERVLVDFRALVDDIWIVDVPGHKGTLIRIKSRGEVTPLDIHQLVLKSKWKQGEFPPPARLEFLIETDDDQDDFTLSRCIECDTVIERNLFGQQLSEERCLKHQSREEITEFGVNKSVAITSAA